MFQIASDVSLGTIYKLKIWHDNTGVLSRHYCGFPYNMALLHLLASRLFCDAFSVAKTRAVNSKLNSNSLNSLHFAKFELKSKNKNF